VISSLLAVSLLAILIRELVKKPKLYLLFFINFFLLLGEISYILLAYMRY
jgi:hypothetical protein